MATKDARGTKLTCQNDDCSARFYDLNHEPPVCPMCGADYVIAAPPEPVAPEPVPEPVVASKAEDGAKAAVKGDVDPDAEAADELADIETDDALDDDSDDSDVFLESDDDEGTGAVSAIVVGVKDDKEDT